MEKPNPASVFGARRDDNLTPNVMLTELEIDTREKIADESTHARRNSILGNPDLPIYDYCEKVIDAVNSSQVTIVVAETGAGKSTQVPQMLAGVGHKVVVTQPRILAARGVSERISEEIVQQKGPDYADFVGYRTARERGDSPDNRILVVTDGLQLVRELSNNNTKEGTVLVLDEAHELNENMEVLLAWSKIRITQDPNFKLVIMSATMDSNNLANFFAEGDTRNVPVIDVPGRTFGVEKHEGGELVAETVRLAKESKNTLVFLPGKTEIDRVMRSLEVANMPGAVIVPLHGQQDKTEQNKALRHYDGVKIVLATNVAQTSITIDDIDAVVDSGLGRENTVNNGIEGLTMRPVSQADCLQRAGRAGRTKPGEYWLCELNGYSFVPMKERSPYGTPEIFRTRLDGTVLRLAKTGMDMSKMEFYSVHSLDIEDRQKFTIEIERAKKRLKTLGALTEDGDVTTVGEQMDRMPLESHYARMMVEARKYSPEVRQQLAAMLAVQEAGGVTFNGKGRPQNWQRLIGEDRSSDIITQFEIFVKAQSMSNQERGEYGIIGRNFSNAQGIYRQLRGVEKLPHDNLLVPTKEQRDQLVRCIVSGMVDSLYTYQSGRYYDQESGRELSNRSVVSAAGIIVGKPFDLQVNTARGAKMLHLIESATEVPSVEVLREVAPQLFSDKHIRLCVGDDGVIMDVRREVFNGRTIGEEFYVPCEASERRTQFLADCAVTAMMRNELSETMQRLSSLQNRTTEKIDIPTWDELFDYALTAMHSSVDNINDAKSFVPYFEIDDILSPEEQRYVEENSPEIYAGLNLMYQNGEVFAQGSLSEVEALKIDKDKIRLPDGRNIIVGGETLASIYKRREADIEMASAEASGRLVHFGGEVRMGRGSDNQGFYVITRDGELRLADENSDSSAKWLTIREGELALQVQHATSDPTLGEYTIAASPNTLTQEQLGAVRSLEREIGTFPGAWSVGKDLMQKQVEIIRALQKDDFIGNLIKDYCYNPNLKQAYGAMMGETGFTLGVVGKHEISSWYDGDNWFYDAKAEQADGREAVLLEEVVIMPEVTVKVLAYEKYGGWCIALKMSGRKDKPLDAHNTNPVVTTGSDQVALDALKSKFNRSN